MAHVEGTHGKPAVWEVLPGASRLPKLEKTDWRELYQKLAGLDPSQCEACGQ